MAKPRKLFLRNKRRAERSGGRHPGHPQHPSQIQHQQHPQQSQQADDFSSILKQSVGSKVNSGTHVTLHLGPANSGKTFSAIEILKQSATGIYLAPLRLLAWEVSDKLNAQGHPCSLLTGEEKIIIPDAPFLSATVEMFNPDFRGDCIVLDESQMLADTQRGWAWMRVLSMAQVRRIEIIASPDSEVLLSKILKKLGYKFTVMHHERLAPLTVAQKPWRIDAPEDHTIFVVFSRAGVLSLKTYFERRGWSVSAIYGNLPPEVKRKQAEHFLTGKSKLCVATDAIGMGINLPASKVCFTTLTKYDGQDERILTPAETRQIAGRAGRFGMKENGEVGALTHEQIKLLHHLLSIKPPDLEFARVAPDISEIESMTGPLALRLDYWEKHKAIPSELKDIILPMDLEHQKTLAGFLKEEEVQRLGLETVFTLIKAPASRDTFSFWWACVRSVIDNKPFPLPLALSRPDPQKDDLLLTTENFVEQCDIYLWLSNRKELSRHGADREKVLQHKWDLIEKIDRTLTAKTDLRNKCRKCNNTLPVLHSYSICEPCFRTGQRKFFRKPKNRRFGF